MKWKDKIKDILNVTISELEKELLSVEKDIQEKKDEYSILVNDYTEFSKTFKDRRDNLERDIRDYTSKVNKLQVDEENFNNEVVQFETEKKDAANALGAIRKEIQESETKLSKIQSELKSTAKLKSDESVLVGNIARLDGIISEKAKQVKEQEEILESIKLAAIESKRNFEIDNKERLFGLERLASDLISNQKRLQALEANLNQKESDLLVVEARWKKLYGEKGANFKV